jgi:hypothetical protein
VAQNELRHPHHLTAALAALAAPSWADVPDWIVHRSTQCLKYQAAALDDGVSDAAEVAAAVRTACSDSIGAVLKAMRGECGGNETCASVATQRIEPTIYALSIRAVLDHRRARR